MPHRTWWKRGIVYQIYPRSFQDTNGDGVGDLRGIRDRLDYLSWLGVDAIWISPIFVSPMKDYGYDVADYCDIDPLFGTLEDFDALVTAAHERGLKVILDFVPNHTSDQHAWFTESRASRANPKRDWYIWRDPAPGGGPPSGGPPRGGPPNNWISNFGGAAWTFDEATGQYYYHAFLREQPDLNWRNPEVRAAMHEVLRFWLRRGVDGFRVDVIWHLMKDPDLTDNPPNPNFREGQSDINRLLQTHSADHPDILAIVAGLRAVLDEFDQRVLIGEIYLPLKRLVDYYGEDLSGAHLPFNFKLIYSAWSAREIGRFIDEYEASIPPGGWPNWVIGNHDQRRIVERVGEAQARIAAMLLLTLRGTPTMYYGDELGIPHVPIPPDRVRDPWELNEPGRNFGRDPERTPMQWDATSTAGFTTGQPWLPLDPGFPTRNVAVEARDPASMLSFYRRLIDLRREHLALAIGSYHAIEAGGDVLAFERRHTNGHCLVALNLGQTPVDIAVPKAVGGGRLLLSTHLDRAQEVTGERLSLRPDEGVVIGYGVESRSY